MSLVTDLEIACQQVLMEDATVFSIQWMVVPSRYVSGLSPALLMERYLKHIRRFTWSIIRPDSSEGRVHFRLLGSRFCLLSFEGPVFLDGSGEESVTLSICGGLLVQPQCCDRGKLTFSCEKQKDGLKLTLLLSDYCPLLLGSATPSLLRKWFYRMTQAAIHRVVTVRFFTRFYRELAGSKACCRVVRGSVAEGEDL